MKTLIPAIVCWLYALWWLAVGIRGYNLIIYMTKGSERYREGLPLVLCLAASLDLILLGYFVLTSNRAYILLLLVVFGILWLAWLRVAKRLGRNRQY